MADNSQRHEQEEESTGRDFVDEQPSESSPLLPRDEAEHTQPQSSSITTAASLVQYLRGSKNGRRRWPSFVALLLLCILAILIIVFAFVAPTVVEEYAQQAVVFEPTSLSIDSFLDDGVRARIQGMFSMDASRVKKKSVRDLGRFCTWIAEEIETGKSQVQVSLPEYGNVVLGTAEIPPVKVYIRNGHTTGVDFLSDLRPGDVDGIRGIANDWIDGRLGQLRIVGKADVPLKSGLLNLGRQSVQQEMLFANDDIPSLPAYKIKKLNFRELELPTGRGMAADVSLQLQNEFPVDFTIPPLGFGVLVESCEEADDPIMVADAQTHEIDVHPKTDVVANVTGIVRKLPDILLQDCPGTSKSPLDILLGNYIHGKENTVYVKGSDSPSLDTPRWITDLMTDITVPVPIPGRTFGHLIKNFTLADTHFNLPDPWAEPGKPESNPLLSAKVRALVALPEEMNFNLSVAKVRANADVYYKGKKLGRLDLSKWQDANSTRVEATPDEGPGLMVESQVEDAPLYIEDEDIFAEVIKRLIFSGKKVLMKIKAEVDVGVDTALGDFTVRRIPADGEVPIERNPKAPPSMGNITDGLNPKLVDLRILETTKTELTIGASINITNPTKYTATIPYIDVYILKNGSLLGHATAKNLEITTGNNSYLQVQAVYNPFDLSGPKAQAIGRELISQYISGWNTSITLQMHEQSIPSLPILGRALSHFPIDFKAPHLGTSPPSDGDDDDNNKSGHFIKNAIMHIFTSTATSTLLSPLKHSTLYIDWLNATALYKDEPAGVIEYDVPFGVPPVRDTPDGEGYVTPRLPVDWSLDSVGYDAVKSALGGTLKVGAKARVGVRLGRWREWIWYEGKGLGCSVRL